MGGPYGAAAGLALGAGRHAGKFLTAAAVLLMLPVLFILMLPSLIFGGLISSGNSGQPILNDNAAIIQNTNDIAFAVNEILGEGITDAEARIAQDFAATSGDNYEIINPYASDMTSNTNSFIAQYCAAKGENWDTISLANMQAILRQGKSGSYHSLIPNAAKAWGLNVEGCTASEPQRIVDALSEGKLVVAIMLKGHFTSGGHFIVLRGVQDGKILVADPASYNRSQKLWELSIILNEASNRAGAGGPFWIIGG